MKDSVNCIKEKRLKKKMVAFHFVCEVISVEYLACFALKLVDKWKGNLYDNF